MRFVFTVNINIIILRSYKLFSGLNILDRSLPLVVYTPQGGTEKSAPKGCLYPVFKGAYLPSARE